MSRKAAKKAANRTNRTPKKGSESVAVDTHSDATKARALVAYRIAGTVGAACDAAGISRSTWYEWRTADEGFRRLVAEAEEDVADRLEATAIARATAKESPSDTLLIFLLKSLRRARFGDKQTLTIVHPDIQGRLQQQASVIATRASWTPDELFAALDPIWHTGTDGDA